jgi:outer membrane receptor protein involved in Fe transport
MTIKINAMQFKLNMIRVNFLLAAAWMFANTGFSQQTTNVTGKILDKETKETVPFANIVLKSASDSSFISGTLSDEQGIFLLEDVSEGSYLLEISSIGYNTYSRAEYFGSLSDFIDLGIIPLSEATQQLEEVVVTGKQSTVSGNMEKLTFASEDLQVTRGGTVLETLGSLPGLTIQDGKIQMRGSENVTILINGKQTALTGLDGQKSLDNLPASGIERIEVINNPSSKYTANGNAGIINIILKKDKNLGLHGKIDLNGGLGALTMRKENYPGIRPQFQRTPKINPSAAINFRKKSVNLFATGDYLFNQTLNKNEFVTRTYANGDIVNQQLKRNRTTHFITATTGLDWELGKQDMVNVSGLFGREIIIDKGDQPFFTQDFSENTRLWQFLEDEVKTTAIGTVKYQHLFENKGHKLEAAFHYTFHQEDEKYFFDNRYPQFEGKDSFKLISDEHVYDFSLDYSRPGPHGKLESGLKVRYRDIPTNMTFQPGFNSPLDVSAGGWANYKEFIPAAYFNYLYEIQKLEIEAGLRMEYVDLVYEVNPNHPTYKTGGYQYFQLFPDFRMAYRLTDQLNLSLFYNKRVDRPREVDIRIFPKYDDAEIIKVGNPELSPQFTNHVEFGLKRASLNGFLYFALYGKFIDGTITRISTIASSNNWIYNVFQNAGKSHLIGTDFIVSRNWNESIKSDFNANFYQNTIDAYTVSVLYPEQQTIQIEGQSIVSGNLKLTNSVVLSPAFKFQVQCVYYLPDILPQGTISDRFSLNAGLNWDLHNGSSLSFSAQDILNTMYVQKQINGNGFSYSSVDYYETQKFMLGYHYKF